MPSSATRMAPPKAAGANCHTGCNISCGGVSRGTIFSCCESKADSLWVDLDAAPAMREALELLAAASRSHNDLRG